MTNDQWFALPEPHSLLAQASGRSGPVEELRRRTRLFGCACVREVWSLITTDVRSAIQVAERVAEGKSSDTDLLAVTVRVSPIVVSAAQLAVSAACYAAGPVDRNLGWGLGDEPLTLFSAHDAARLAARARASGSSGPAPAGHTRKTGAWHAAWTKAYDEARATQAQIVRDIFPPPDYAPQFDPAWRTTTVVALGRQMDESGDFSIVPILADALEDAGCDDVTLLQCCRVPGGVHVRGNWAVDLVLGRG